MAERLCFISTPQSKSIFKEVFCEFTYYNGFAISQKQKSIKSLHNCKKNSDLNLNVLEVSTKSPNPIGVQLSAFSLKFFDEENNDVYPLENIFQSSKVFENGGPYIDLLNKLPKDAKRDERLKTSGKLKCFYYNNRIWDIEPKTMFYDWIYIKALSRNKKLSKEILNYNAFTDIEFNHNKSINCQARAAAIFVSLSKLGVLEQFLENKDMFRTIYYEDKLNEQQIDFFE